MTVPIGIQYRNSGLQHENEIMFSEICQIMFWMCVLYVAQAANCENQAA